MKKIQFTLDEFYKFTKQFKRAGVRRDKGYRRWYKQLTEKKFENPKQFFRLIKFSHKIVLNTRIKNHYPISVDGDIICIDLGGVDS